MSDARSVCSFFLNLIQTVDHKLKSLDVIFYQIHQVAFSPHTDAKGIMDLTKFLSPKNVVLVHGEKPSMMSLKDKITSELDIPCFVPANGETVSVASTAFIKANASDMFLKSCSNPNLRFSNSSAQLRVTDQRTSDGVLVIEKSKKAKIVHQDEVSEALREEDHIVSLAYCCPVKVKGETDGVGLIKLLSKKISETVSYAEIHESETCLQVGSFKGSLCLKEECVHRRGISSCSEVKFLCCNWSVADLELGWEIINAMKQNL